MQTTIYQEADTVLTGKVNLVRGKQTDERITLVAKINHAEASESKEISADLTLTGMAIEYKWDTKNILKNEEMYVSTPIRLLVESKGYAKTKDIPVVLYRSTLELLVLVVEKDKEGNEMPAKPKPGVGCKLIIRIDEGFLDSECGWRKDCQLREDGAREWTRETDDNGKITFDGLPLGSIRIEFLPPYAVRPDGWKTEGEYTETGPKRKVEVGKLPVVHYIWWGNPTQDKYLNSATATPNDMASILQSVPTTTYSYGLLYHTFLPKTLVYLWRKADDDALAERLHPNVVQRPVTKLSDLVMEKNWPIDELFMGRGAELDRIHNALTQYKMYAAAKDLLSLCVLYRYGGYYFDTTTLVPKDNRDSTPDTFVSKQPDDIRFPKTKTKGSFQFYRHDNSISATLVGNNIKFFREMGDGREFKSVGLDVWAMYAPPRHPAIPIMIVSYIERAKNFGLDSFPANKRIAINCFGTTEWRESWNGMTFDQLNEMCNSHNKPLHDQALNARNLIIGSLMISSVQEGLVSYAFECQKKPVPSDEQETLRAIKAYLWETGAPSDDMKEKYKPAPVQIYLNDFNNLPKAHSGMWRAETTATTEGDGANAINPGADGDVAQQDI
jgi:hypothetical protein